MIRIGRDRSGLADTTTALVCVLWLAVGGCGHDGHGDEQGRDADPDPTLDAVAVADADADGDADADADAGPPDGGGCAPGPGASEPVTLAGEIGALGGTLEVPAGCAPFPVVVILSGSGSTDRNGNDPELGGPDEYEMLAQALRDAGVASIRYDDHGIGASAAAAPARVEDFRFDVEIADAARWVAHARTDARFDRVLLAGHSQGSLSALIAAQRVPVDGIVSLAGTSLPAGRLLMEQLAPHLTAQEQLALARAVTELEAGRLVNDLPPRLADLMPLDVQPYLASWFRFDPIAQAELTSVPMLVVHGTTDHTVPLEHARMLAAARAETQLVIIEGMAHSLKQAGDDRASQNRARTDPSVPLAAGLVDAVAGFAVGADAD